MSAGPPIPKSAALPKAEQYKALLAEAEAIKGVSLGKDAWRRLRRNYTAMASLYFLCLVAALAFLTPLIPLQSPIDTDLKNRQLKPPNFKPVRLGEREQLKFKDNSLVAELGVYREAWKKYQSDLAVHRQKTAPLRKKLKSATLEEQGKINEALEKENPSAPVSPIEKLWNNPGPVTRLFIYLRIAIFGDWCIPSICGTDNLGRDLLARLFWGARVSLVVGIVATLVSLIIGVSYGAVAGYLGGRVDNIMMRIVDVMYAIPFIFVVIFLIMVLSEDDIKKVLEAWHISRIHIFYVVIGAIYWLTMSRVVRGQVISLKNEQFIDAAKTVGASRGRIVFRHLVPNVMGVVIVYLTLTIPSVMLFEAFLSFLGLGVEPPDVSWGLLINDGVQVITPIKIYWWLVLFTGLALSLTLFALNFLGDGLRDALDPRMKNR
jgi:oligopeptide transport system permease protein